MIGFLRSKINPTADNLPDRLHAASVALGASLDSVAARADELRELAGGIVAEFGRDANALQPIDDLCTGVARQSRSMAEGFNSTQLRDIAVAPVAMRAAKAVGRG
jgi:hypothetical protein